MHRRVLTTLMLNLPQFSTIFVMAESSTDYANKHTYSANQKGKSKELNGKLPCDLLKGKSSGLEEINAIYKNLIANCQ